MEHWPFEDVFLIKNGDVPASYVSLQEGKWLETEIAVSRNAGLSEQQSTQQDLILSLQWCSGDEFSLFRRWEVLKHQMSYLACNNTQVCPVVTSKLVFFWKPLGWYHWIA